MKKPKKKTKKICETFEIEKSGKTKEITSCGTLEEKAPNKEQIKKQDKQLKNIFLVFLIFIFLIFAVVFITNSSKHVKYENLDFYKDKTGDLTLYYIKVPLYNTAGENYANYNVWLRTNPKKLKHVSFNGSVVFKKYVVINFEEEFNCNGDGIVAIANLQQLYTALGAKVMKDENATCDPEARYIYLTLKQGDETKIIQTAPACYDLIINNCEILKATEKLIIENLVELNQ